MILTDLKEKKFLRVLRLIRNTADLNNTIYLVAYGKEYVTTVLEEKNIKDAASYLEKIFPVEVHLPKVEDNLIWETLYGDLNCQERFNGRFTKSLFARFNNDERALILRVLNNYRRAKRFSRLYILNVDYVMVQCRDEIKLLICSGWNSYKYMIKKSTICLQMIHIVCYAMKMVDSISKTIYCKVQERMEIMCARVRNSGKMKRHKYWKGCLANSLKPEQEVYVTLKTMINISP